MTDIRHTVEEACAGTMSRGACEDSLFERLGFQTAVGAGGIGLGGSPGRVSSQVHFSRLSFGGCLPLCTCSDP